MKINFIALLICSGSLIIYIGVLVFYCIKFNKIKKLAPKEKIFAKTTKYFKSVMITSIILIILPVLVPMEIYMIAIICACGILAEIIALKERKIQIEK